MIRIGFEKPGNGIISKLIANHDEPRKYCHCAFWWADDLVFEAHIENGVRFNGYKPDASWDLVAIDTNLQEEAAIRRFCEICAGDGYDCCGIAALAGVPLAKEDPDKWFCSEIVTKALQLIGRVPELVSYQTSPNQLYLAIGVK